MDPLKPSSQLAASLRALRLRRTDGTTSQGTPADGAATSAERPADLRQRLSGLVSRVDPADPEDVRRARKPVISAILLAEFGDAARADPRFGEMVASVEAALSMQDDGIDPFLDLLHALKRQDQP